MDPDPDQNPYWIWIQIGIQSKMPDPDEVNADPQPWFRYRSLLSEQNQNVLISSGYYRNESRTLQCVPKLFKIESERFGDFLKFKNETRTKPS